MEKDTAVFNALNTGSSLPQGVEDATKTNRFALSLTQSVLSHRAGRRSHSEQTRAKEKRKPAPRGYSIKTNPFFLNLTWCSRIKCPPRIVWSGRRCTCTRSLAHSSGLRQHTPRRSPSLLDALSPTNILSPALCSLLLVIVFILLLFFSINSSTNTAFFCIFQTDGIPDQEQRN